MDLPAPQTRLEVMFPPAQARRPWNHAELLEMLPASGARVLDIGAGRNPLAVRAIDELVTVDFEAEAGAEVTVNIVEAWPFNEEQFDLIYMSHVLEHFYPTDRDAVIRNIYTALRPGGLLLIRVPHRSSYQAVGWEHYSLFDQSSVVSLSHGHNPTLPMLRTVSVGVSLSMDFYTPRSRSRALLERGLSRYWRLTDTWLCHLVGGIPEVQYMLQRMDPATERRLRDSPPAFA
jgi:SAM-dependent methyltransferase